MTDDDFTAADLLQAMYGLQVEIEGKRREATYGLFDVLYTARGVQQLLTEEMLSLIVDDRFREEQIARDLCKLQAIALRIVKNLTDPPYVKPVRKYGEAARIESGQRLYGDCAGIPASCPSGPASECGREEEDQPHRPGADAGATAGPVTS